MIDETINTLLMQLPAILLAVASLIIALKGKSETKAALNKSIEIEKELGIGEFASREQDTRVPEL